MGEHLLAHPCVDCGETDIRVLDFDHLPQFAKTKNVMVMVNLGFSIARIRDEIDKVRGAVPQLPCASDISTPRTGLAVRSDEASG